MHLSNYFFHSRYFSVWNYKIVLILRGEITKILQFCSLELHKIFLRMKNFTFTAWHYESIPILQYEITKLCLKIIPILSHRITKKLSYFSSWNYKKHSCFTEWNYKNIPGGKVLTTLEDLTTRVTYSIRVSAINSAGEGPLSQPVKVKTIQRSKYLYCFSLQISAFLRINSFRKYQKADFSANSYYLLILAKD